MRLGVLYLRQEVGYLLAKERRGAHTLDVSHLARAAPSMRGQQVVVSYGTTGEPR